MFTFTYNKIISNKNLIVINKTNSIITIGSLNNNTLRFESEEFLVYENNFINSSNLYIGGHPNNIPYENNLQKFSGYMDRFYIFKNIPFIYADSLSYGLFSNPTGYDGILREDCYTTGFLSGSGYNYNVTGIFTSGFQSGIIDITGYQEILSGYSYTGVTGSQTNIIGSYIDNCGNSINIIENIPLSGLISGQIPITVNLTGIKYITGFIDVQTVEIISGIQNIYVTGSICSSYFDITGNIKYEYDNNYLSSLSYKEISLLTTANSSNIEPLNNDIIEIFAEEYKNITLEYNKDLTFDNLNQNYFYIDREFKPNEVLMFGNGQAIIDSGYQLIPSGYEVIKSPNLDYFITGTTIETNKFFGTQDDLFYDYFSGNFWAYKNTGNLINIPNNINNNYWIFKNGQKLIQNNDFILTGIGQILLNNVSSNEENYIIFKEFPNNFNYLSGNSGSLILTNNFNHKCSQVYFNGVKQKINTNYIENSNFDMISGNFYESEIDKPLIYNNTDDFFV
jgi:hypothetical protein